MILTYLLDGSVLPDPLECEKQLSCLPKERIEKIYRLKHIEARKQSFGAGLLLDYALREVCKICGGEAEIRYNPYGKPLLKAMYHSCGEPLSAQVPFNLSHSGKYIILSILSSSDARGQETGGVFIGCDIEQVKKYNPKTAKRFFTETEYRMLEGITDKKAQAEMFFRYWTKKESVLKLTGLGMALPMDLFDVSRSREVFVSQEKTAKWYAAVQEKEKQTEREKQTGKEREIENKIENKIEKEHTECRQAADILLHTPLYLQEYCYDDYRIAVCSSQNRFAPEFLLKKACIGGHVMIN